MNIRGAEFLQQADELNISVQKFLTYCGHLQTELAIGDGQSDKQHEGYGYVSIIQYELLGNQNNRITNKDVLDTLILLLEEDFFDIDFYQYSHVYRMFRDILHHYQGEEDYSGKVRKLRKKGISLAIPPEVKMLSHHGRQNIDFIKDSISDKALYVLKDGRIEKIEELACELIETMLNGNEDQLTHDFLNPLLHELEDSFSYESLYMGIIHLEFDELIEIQTVYHKALNILGILVCDFLPGDHKLFENASELFLVNIRSKKTHRAVKYLCNEKQGLNNNTTSP